jgi:hypothetical protein
MSGSSLKNVVPTAFAVERIVKVKVLGVRGLDKCNFIELSVEQEKKYTKEDKHKERDWGDEFEL